jgi:hypothetical protein
MIEIPFNDDFCEQMDRTGSHGVNPCIVCGRNIKNKRAKRVYVNSGFSHILTAEEFQQDEGEMGSWPVGADCLSKHPEIRPYIIVS